MRIYIIGPVSGREGDNRAEFEWARMYLRDKGFQDVTIPHDLIPSTATWEEAMRESITAIMGSDAVAMLPGWAKSKGASIEATLCAQIGIPCMPVTQWGRKADLYGRQIR